MDPTLDGFITFMQRVMGITTVVLSFTDPSIQASYDYATNIVITALQCVPSQPTSPSIYATAIYNLAGDTLINIAPDGTGSNPDSTYFAGLRTLYNILGFVAGVANEANDQGTGVGITVSNVMENLSFLNLQQLKTPWGRMYLGLAGQWGPWWGLS